MPANSSRIRRRGNARANDLKTALVTGSGRGIGRAIALKFAERHKNVAVLDIDFAAAEETAALVNLRGGRAIALAADVTDRPTVETAFDSAVTELGPIQVLVNNAGVLAVEPFEVLSYETWSRVLNVNLNGAFHASQVFLRRLLSSRLPGAIVNMSSVSAKIAFNGSSSYNVSKAAIEGLTRCLAVEYGQHGIRCNAVAPGIIVTEMTKSALLDDGLKSEWRQRVPMRDFGSIDNVADTVVFLASEEAGYINGESIVVDGGALANWSKPDDTTRPVRRTWD